MDDYRTDLTGLTQDEAAAMMSMGIPAPLEALQIGPHLKAALRKLHAALPPAAADRPAVHLDWAGWGQDSGQPEPLQTLYRALQAACRVQISYQAGNGVEVEQVVDPLGLVGKAGVWYFIYGAYAKITYQRVSELQAVEALGEPRGERAGFDLAGYWQTQCSEVERALQQYRVVLQALPAVVSVLLQRHGGRVMAQSGGLTSSGRVVVEVAYESYQAARERLMGIGRAVEVIEPPELRLGIADYAQQILGLYQPAEKTRVQPPDLNPANGVTSIR